MIGDSAQYGGEIGTAYLAYCRRRLAKEYMPRLLKCLTELSEEDLWWRPSESANSAGNLVLHLAGNVDQWINSGMGGTASSRNRAAEFSERGPLPKNLLVEKISDVLTRADSTLAGFDPSRLMERRKIQVYEVTCLDAVSHVVEHFAQHLGQIIYITKLRRGVDLRFYDL